MEQFYFGRRGYETLDDKEIFHIVQDGIKEGAMRYRGCRPENLNRVLIIPPDYTRLHSYAGNITVMLTDIIKNSNPSCVVDIMPALGTHEPMSDKEFSLFFGSRLQADHVFAHNWKTDTVKIGEVPSDVVNELSEGLLDYPIEIEVNYRLLEQYDLIISVGQVVPHEIAGMANYSKNIFVGCGGSTTISKTHMLAAAYGLERVIGSVNNPVRAVFDYAEERFIKDLPLVYFLTVTTQSDNGVNVHGLFGGRGRRLFNEAARLSGEKNIIVVPYKIKKAVVYLEEAEFKSLWLGNKSIYRTRMALAKGADLIIIAPGARKFGEDDEVDLLIRKYGYIGRLKVLEMMKTEKELAQNLSVASHLIYGSSDDLLNITYCTGFLTQDEVESVGYNYLPVDKAVQMHSPASLKNGFNILDSGEKIYFIQNPALGLWMSEDIVLHR